MKKVVVKMSNCTSFSADLADKIVAKVKQYGFIALAAEEYGIHRMTAYGWMKQGLADPTGVYGTFAKEVTAAKANFGNRLLKQVQDPKWILARLDKELFSEASINNITVNNVPTRTPLTRDEAIAELKALVKSDPDILKALNSDD